MTEKPKLIVGSAGRGEPIYYICSYCLRGFPLPDIQPPRAAVKELYNCFREHIEHEHPEAAEGPIPASA